MSPSDPPQLSTVPAAPEILVVEDDPDLSSLYQRILGKQGTVRCCGSLGQALEEIRTQVPDVILLDLGLPDSQGLQGLGRLRTEAPGAAVVITTGARDESLALEALRNGAQDYLLKGRLEAAVLSRAVRYALERKQAEKTLREREELFSIITNHMVDLLSIIGADGSRIYTSPSYPRLLGFSEEEMAGQNLRDLVHPEDRKKVQEALVTLFGGGLSQGLEYRIQRRDGSYLPLESNAVRITDRSDDHPRAVLVARDISARKTAEAERERMEVQLRHAQKLESIGQLAAGIAHEINTPTQYIGDNANFLADAFRSLGQALEAQRALLARWASGTAAPQDVAAAEQVIQEADVDFLMEEIPKAIDQTLEGVKRVTRIVGAMKEFSHPGGDTRSRTDLNRAIESTVTVCRNEWKYVADLELDLAPDLPFAPCFPSEFNQAILNLIINAAHAIEEAKHGEKGHIRIQTRAVDDAVEIRIEDTGCGIPAGIRDRVFDPFFTTKPVGKGSGQGLSIVHAVIVDKHKGSIRLESEVGSGTAFILRLPLKEV